MAPSCSLGLQKIHYFTKIKKLRKHKGCLCFPSVQQVCFNYFIRSICHLFILHILLHLEQNGCLADKQFRVVSPPICLIITPANFQIIHIDCEPSKLQLHQFWRTIARRFIFYPCPWLKSISTSSNF